MTEPWVKISSRRASAAFGFGNVIGMVNLTKTKIDDHCKKSGKKLGDIVKQAHLSIEDLRHLGYTLLDLSQAGMRGEVFADKTVADVKRDIGEGGWHELDWTIQDLANAGFNAAHMQAIGVDGPSLFKRGVDAADFVECVNMDPRGWASIGVTWKMVSGLGIDELDFLHMQWKASEIAQAWELDKKEEEAIRRKMLKHIEEAERQAREEEAQSMTKAAGREDRTRVERRGAGARENWVSDRVPFEDEIREAEYRSASYDDRYEGRGVQMISPLPPSREHMSMFSAWSRQQQRPASASASAPRNFRGDDDEDDDDDPPPAAGASAVRVESGAKKKKNNNNRHRGGKSNKKKDPRDAPKIDVIAALLS